MSRSKFLLKCFYSAGLLTCRFVQVESHGPPEPSEKTPNTRVFAEFPTSFRGYHKEGSFTCKAKAHPRGKVKLEVTTNGQQFVGAGSTAISLLTTFVYIGCPTGYVAPFYYRSCSDVQGKYGTMVKHATWAACYTDVNASPQDMP